MGGRSGSSGMGGGSRYTDSTDFKEFQKLNFDAMKALHKQGGMEAVREAWYQTRVQSELQNAHEMSKEEAIGVIMDAIPRSMSHGWFVEANSEYKPKITQSVLQTPGALNAGWNIAYSNYVESLPSGQTPIGFNKWLKTPQTLYRGTRGQKTVKSDVFSSYSPSKKIAQSFGSHVSSINVKPKDTWGSFQTTGEQEFLIPAYKLR